MKQSVNKDDEIKHTKAKFHNLKLTDDLSIDEFLNTYHKLVNKLTRLDNAPNEYDLASTIKRAFPMGEESRYSQ